MGSLFLTRFEFYDCTMIARRFLKYTVLGILSYNSVFCFLKYYLLRVLPLIECLLVLLTGTSFFLNYLPSVSLWSVNDSVSTNWHRLE